MALQERLLGLGSEREVKRFRRDSLNWPQGDGLKRLHLRGGGVSS
jgi:hypothetical protein